MDDAAQNESATSEAPTPKPTPSTNAKPKMSKKPIIITSAIGLVLIVLVSLGIYLWQQGIVKGLYEDKGFLEAKMVSQSAQIATLGKDNTDLKTRINFLEKELREATASSQLELGELDVTVGGAKHYGSGGYFDPSYEKSDFLLVDVTVKNNTKQNLFLSLFNFKLKDSDNKTHPHYTASAVGSQPRFSSGVESLPQGKVELRDQQVSVGETVVGTLIFYVPMNENLFTLFYNTEKFTITVK